MLTDAQAFKFLELVGDGVLLVDGEFRVVWMNAHARRIAIRPFEDLIGRTMWELFPDLRETELGEMLVRVLAEGAPASMDVLFTRYGGNKIWLDVRACPAEDGLAIFYRDIGDRKRAEEELKRTQAELMHASRVSAMGTMGATLAHELAQPLTAAANYIAASKSELRGLPPDLVREARKGVKQAGDMIERATETLQRLRAFVARGHVETAVHDLQAVIADASLLMLPLARREGVEIGFALDRYARWVRVDAVQVQQVLINLVKNAVEAVRESPDKRVTVSTAPARDGNVEIAVADSGPGLGGMDEEALFAPFRSGKGDGMGVGLSICRTIVEAHGGTIKAEPAPTGGAVFRFTLPRGEEPRLDES